MIAASVVVEVAREPFSPPGGALSRSGWRGLSASRHCDWLLMRPERALP